MKAKKNKNKSYEYLTGVRSVQSFYLRTEVKAAFRALAKEGGCYNQHLMDAVILRAVAASPQEKIELFRVAHEGAKTAAMARVERKFAKAPEASITEA
jgi:hypothetical protein